MKAAVQETNNHVLHTWRDVTVYARSDDATAQPRSWRADLGQVEVTVHRSHQEPRAWFVSTRPQLVFHRRLKSQELENAMIESLGVVRDWLTEGLVLVTSAYTRSKEQHHDDP